MTDREGTPTQNVSTPPVHAGASSTPPPPPMHPNALQTALPSKFEIRSGLGSSGVLIGCGAVLLLLSLAAWSTGSSSMMTMFWLGVGIALLIGGIAQLAGGVAIVIDATRVQFKNGIQARLRSSAINGWNDLYFQGNTLYRVSDNKKLATFNSYSYRSSDVEAFKAALPAHQSMSVPIVPGPR